MASRRGTSPRLWAYRVRPSLRAFSAASRITRGVSKSGSPNSRWMMSLPSRSSSCARWKTSTARNGWMTCERLDVTAAPSPTARADRNVRARLDRRLEAHDLADGRGAVGIRHEPEQAPRRTHARADREALAVVRAQTMERHRRMRRLRLEHARGRVVAAAVVHDQDLVGLAPPVEVG